MCLQVFIAHLPCSQLAKKVNEQSGIYISSNEI